MTQRLVIEGLRHGASAKAQLAGSLHSSVHAPLAFAPETGECPAGLQRMALFCKEMFCKFPSLQESILISSKSRIKKLH